MKTKQLIQFAATLNKSKTAWCYSCNSKSVQWDGKKYICRNKHCQAVHEEMRSCNE